MQPASSTTSDANAAPAAGSALVADAEWARFACPFCKSQLDRGDDARWVCRACNTPFPRVDGIRDFRLRYPSGVHVPPGWDAWVEGQRDYEKAGVTPKYAFGQELLEAQRNNAWVYEGLLQMRGRVLDVGGGGGIVREFLSASDRYLSIDPWLGAPAWLAAGEAAMGKRDPRVRTPVPFVAGNAEWLPFEPASFDWVHMRSVVDHFLDPFQALREAWRVLVPGGHVALATSAHGGSGSAVLDHGMRGLAARVVHKARTEGLRGVLERIKERMADPWERDVHLWHPSLENLSALFKAAGFAVDDWKWAPPHNFVVYMRASKPR